jgi:hypothetical protein
MDNNYDDITLQPGDDREFKNQFKEFLQKNMRIEEPIKKNKPKVIKRKREHQLVNSLFNYENSITK